MSDHFFDLILSGHTHGGQYFPYNFLIWIGNPYFRSVLEVPSSKGENHVAIWYHAVDYAPFPSFVIFRGLYTDVGPEGKSQVYVTEGSVFWGSPFRLASTMEISKIVLTN